MIFDDMKERRGTKVFFNILEPKWAHPLVQFSDHLIQETEELIQNQNYLIDVPTACK